MSRETLGLFLGFIGVVVFAVTLPATRLAVLPSAGGIGLDPWFVAFGRAALAGCLAAIVLLVLRRRLPARRHLGLIALAAMLLGIGFPAFTGFAMQLVPAGHGGVVLGILPLATAAVSALATGERLRPAFWAVAVLGAVIVTGFALRQGGGRVEPGDLLLLGAVASAACGYTVSAKLARLMPGWEVISWILVLALPVTVPLAWWMLPAQPQAVSGVAWAGFAYVTLMSQYLGFFAWNAGLALGGVARVSQVQLLQTFVTLIVAALITGEEIEPLTWVVAVAVVGLIFLARLLGQQRKAPA